MASAYDHLGRVLCKLRAESMRYTWHGESETLADGTPQYHRPSPLVHPLVPPTVPPAGHTE